MDADKRYYSRYVVSLEGRVATEKGVTFPVEIIDISGEGVRIRTDSQVLLNKGDIINVLIKWKSSIKGKAEIRWIKNEKSHTELGVMFIEMDMPNREALASLISEIALSNLNKIYPR
jgi:hypothetical protein